MHKIKIKIRNPIQSVQGVLPLSMINTGAHCSANGLSVMDIIFFPYFSCLFLIFYVHLQYACFSDLVVFIMQQLSYHTRHFITFSFMWLMGNIPQFRFLHRFLLPMFFSVLYKAILYFHSLLFHVMAIPIMIWYIYLIFFHVFFLLQTHSPLITKSPISCDSNWHHITSYLMQSLDLPRIFPYWWSPTILFISINSYSGSKSVTILCHFEEIRELWDIKKELGKVPAGWTKGHALGNPKLLWSCDLVAMEARYRHLKWHVIGTLIWPYMYWSLFHI